MVMTIEKDRNPSFIEVTIQPNEKTMYSSVRFINVETVPVRVIFDRTPALEKTVHSNFETSDPTAVEVDMKSINETAEQKVERRHPESGPLHPKESESPLWYLFGKNPLNPHRVLDMTLKEFLQRYGEGKKQKVDFEHKPYHWIPLELHRPRSEGYGGQVTHHKGPWYMFSTTGEHNNGDNV
jgi:hypothetical protein